MKVIDGFNKIVGSSQEKISISRKFRHLKKQKPKKLFKKAQIQQMKLVPSLKHKTLKRNTSQKKIESSDR